jgi:ribosomal protein S8
MVNNTASIFSSRFNQAVTNRKRTFTVPVSIFSSAMLNLFMRAGYVLNYHTIDANTFIVFLNLRAVNFKLQPVSKSEQFRQLSSRNFRRSSNSGVSFIVNTFTGFCFSDIAIISKLGGSVLFKLNYLN